MLSDIRDRLEDLISVVNEVETTLNDDTDTSEFSQINPKEYISWLFNTDTDGKAQELIDELSYWNSGRL